MMKLRLAQPETLVDINGLTELSYIDVTGTGATPRPRTELRIGALTRHAQLLADPAVGAQFAILHDAEQVIADPIVRNWGTIGGSLCQADPSEDLSAAFAALKATMVIRHPGGSRTVPARDFHTGPYETVVAPGELLTEIRIAIRPGGGSAYAKVGRRVGDWPVARPGRPCGWTVVYRGRPHRRGRDRAHRGRGRALRCGRGRGVPARRPGHRGRLGRAGQIAGRALPPGVRPARPGRLQAAPGPGTHHPLAAPRGAAGPG